MSLIELVVVMSIMAIVFASILSVFTSVQRSEVFTRARSEALDDMRTTLARMSRDFRQATAVRVGSTATTADMDTFVGGVATRVVYQATGTTVTRSQGSGPPVVIQREVLLMASSPLFAYTSSPPDTKIVTITLKVKPSRLPDTTLVLDSRVRLRNVARAA